MKRHRKMPKLVENDPVIVGFEPTTTGMIRAYNYHNENTDIKKGREWIATFIKNSGTPEQLEAFNALRDDRISMWLCVNCYIMNKGKSLTAEDYGKTIDRINELTKPLGTPTSPVGWVSELGNPVVAMVESILDSFYVSGYKPSDPGVYERFKNLEVTQKDAKAVQTFYTPLLEELNAANQDADFKEAYSSIKPKAFRAYVDFVTKIVDDCRLYTQSERKVRKARKPRKIKIKSADQLVSRVQFKAEDRELKLTSMPPAKIIGANTVWIYNTKYKKLTLLVAEGENKLSVKGTTIVGFEEKKSKAKLIRKPEFNLPKLLGLGKIAMAKEFDKLKTREQPAKGRLSADTLILRIL